MGHKIKPYQYSTRLHDYREKERERAQERGRESEREGGREMMELVYHCWSLKLSQPVSEAYGMLQGLVYLRT